MAKQQEPYSLWFVHEDGRGVEAILEDFQQLYLPYPPGDHPGGLYLGSDPACDVVLDGDDVEGFHGVYSGRGHHQYFELIAGRMGEGEHVMYPGDHTRGGFAVGGWRFGIPERLHRDGGDPAVRAAMAIAEDARQEGRAADAAEILAQVGLARVEVPRRKALPAPLAASEQLLRIRVERVEGPEAAVGGGPTAVWLLGTIARLAGGVTIGAAPGCDLVLPEARETQIRLVQQGNLWVHVHNGAAESFGWGRERAGPGERFELVDRWDRVLIGDVVVQLCRWPAQGEPLL